MTLTFDELRAVNLPRVRRWHTGPDAWGCADWSNAMCGEAGEAANVIKKIRRHETGLGDSANTPPMAVLVPMLADELADLIIYADILADQFDINLGEAVRHKFNVVSERQNFPEKL